MTKIGIYGTGMFGFALAKHFGEKFKNDTQYEIVSYDRNKEIVEHINKTKSHPYHFPNVKLDSKNIITNDIHLFLKNTDILILSVPSQSVRDVVHNLKMFIGKDIIIINTAKALECKTNKRLSEVIIEELTDIEITHKVAHFSGGTIAADLVRGAPLGAEIACEDIQLCKVLQKLFSNESLRVYGNIDIKGVEYAGAFKNVIAILAGIASGFGLPYGSETHLITRAAKEARELAVQMGAKEHTFSIESQAWGNDLWMSCTGNTRNRYFGELIGKGITPENALKILKSEHKIAEGYNTAKIIPKLSEKLHNHPCILMQIHNILYECKKPNDAINGIMEMELEFLGPHKFNVE